jgi:predicted nucleotidyltransferase
MAEIVNIGQLPESAAKKIRPYLENMIELLGNNLITAAVYGSAVTGDYSEKRSDINLILVCEDVDLSTLKKSLKLVAKGIRERITAPLFFTRRYIETSADVFPIEFLEIKENHLVLYGEDILSGIRVDLKNLRYQCEEQIKGKLVRIRQAYLEVGLKKKGVEALLKRSLSSLLPVFRNVLRLKGEDPPRGKEEVLAKLALVFSLEAEVFITIWQDRQNDEKIGGEDAEIYLERYLTQLEKLAAAVDSI